MSTLTTPASSAGDSWPVRRDRIAKRYLDMLDASQSPLLAAGPSVLSELRRQLLATVDDAAGQSNDTGAKDLSANIGRERAASGVHPSASLAAANMIFAAALPDLTDHLAGVGVPDPHSEAALRLNASILQRMAAAAASYVEYLLVQAHEAHRHEAARLSRALHDEVGPVIAVGLQHIDLVAYWSEHDPAVAKEKAEAGRQTLVDAMALVRTLAAETRVAVEPGQIGPALRAVLETAPLGIQTGFSTNSSLENLAPYYGHEVFLILREAARNAFAHAAPDRVSITIDLRGTTLQAAVQDDGHGFDAASVPSGTGRRAMRERAALIGADLTTKSDRSGTTVTLTLPLPDRIT